MEKVYMEDYQVGEKLVSPGRTITETDIVLFAALTGDWHPLHTNVEYAAKTIFGERIAHGMLVLVIGSALGFRLGQYVFLPKSFIAFYGMDSVRYTGPVKIGDTIRLEVEVTELKGKDAERGIVTTRNAIKNQRGEDCCIFVSKILCGRRPG
ncbi:MAG: MaoC/PaaZ C-terminal domain-containing protein [bacterium]